MSLRVKTDLKQKGLSSVICKLSAVLICVVLLSGCKGEQDKERTVSVSILPQRYFVERIAGDGLKVNVLIPPGANPAATDLTPAQLVALNNSSIYFAVGHLPFEVSHLYPVLEEHSDVLLVNHSEGLNLLEGSCSCGHDHAAAQGDDHDCAECEHGDDHDCTDQDECGHEEQHEYHDAHHEHHEHHEHAGFDPHIWMSPRYADHMARQIMETLVKKFPEQRELFEKNYADLKEDIDAIDREARRIIGAKQHKVFLIYHPALAYFAAEYGLEQVAIEHEGKEPSPAHIKEVVDRCREQGIRLVFIQHQFDEVNARVIAREINGEVISIDPLSPDWKKEMQQLLDIIEKRME